ncbi:putative lipoprotein [hydrothermal vent metagenome]|uniref:Putative lipoprotein n=1 Tax=hydrothermal vent metagenome TaxID=652676 RepID=A0A3B0YFU1_9ZZZZ
MFRLSIIACLLLLSACTTVQPWEKDLLAKPSMALVPDQNESFLDEHVYFSKEASTGGQGVGGGGCGCN